MIFDYIGINYKIIELYIKKNETAIKKKKKITKITKYIGGTIQKINDLNNLKNIDIDTNECAYNITNPICFDKAKQNDIKKHIDNLNTPDSGVKADEFDINDVKKKMNCDSQKCIALKMGMDLTIFKPDGPATSNKLLSNVDIDSVLKQFELKFLNFKALSFTMDDWFNTSYSDHDIAKLGSDPHYICNILRNNKTCIGFIINTDKWSGDGIHWTSIFVDMRDNKEWSVEFFNSSGNTPSKNIKKLIDNIVNNLYLCNSKPYDCTVTHINVAKNEHQLSDTECGLYGIFMIYNRCRGISLKYFENNEYEKIHDDTMTLFRKYIFWNV